MPGTGVGEALVAFSVRKAFRQLDAASGAALGDVAAQRALDERVDRLTDRLAVVDPGEDVRVAVSEPGVDGERLQIVLGLPELLGRGRALVGEGSALVEQLVQL